VTRLPSPFKTLLVVLAFTLGLGNLHAQQPKPDSPEDLFRAALAARPQICYEGLAALTTWRPAGPAVSHCRIYHAPDGSLRREYETIPGKRTDVYVQTPAAFIFWRADATPLIARRYPPVPPVLESLQDPGLILRNYVVASAGEDTLAGRRARVLTLKSRQGRRPQLRLWIDPETRMILRETRTDLEGRDLTDRTFREIRFPECLDPALFAPPAEAHVEDMAAKIAPPPDSTPLTPAEILDDARRRLDAPLTLPAALPEGFQLITARFYTDPSPGPARWTLQLGYSDGLAPVSVFIQRIIPVSDPTPAGAVPEDPSLLRDAAGHKVPFTVLTHKGVEVTDYSRDAQTILHRRTDDLSITLIGDIDRTDLLDMIISIRPEEPRQP